MSKKSPQLRFEGFTDDWEERKLSEIADIMDGDRGKNYPNGDDFSETGHTLFMSATNVTKNGFKFDETQYISEEKSDSLGNGKIIEDDLILTSRGTVGNLALYDADAKRQIPFARINSGMLILRKKQNESAEFVCFTLRAKFFSSSFSNLSLMCLDVTNFPSLPKNGESLIVKSMLIVGSSTAIVSNASGAS